MRLDHLYSPRFRSGKEGIGAPATTVPGRRRGVGPMSLHTAISEEEKEAAWAEIEEELRRFEGPGRFEEPCELVVGGGTR